VCVTEVAAEQKTAQASCNATGPPTESAPNRHAYSLSAPRDIFPLIFRVLIAFHHLLRNPEPFQTKPGSDVVV